jgi:serine/threonine protein kinase
MTNFGKPTKLLGSGSGGSVWESTTGFAIKTELNDIQGVPSFSCKEEMCVLGYADVCPNVIKLLGFDVEEAITLLYFDLFDSDLSSVLTRPRTVAENDALARDLCLGLASMHEIECPHFDIKPANILLKGGKAVIGDLGIGAIGAQEIENTDRVVTTLPWRSPEAILGGRVTLATDVWSMGIVLWQIYAASPRAPFGENIVEANTIANIWRETSGVTEAEKLLPLYESFSTIAGPNRGYAFLHRVRDTKVRGIIGRMLALNPGDRPTMRQVLGELDESALLLMPERWRPYSSYLGDEKMDLDIRKKRIAGVVEGMTKKFVVRSDELVNIAWCYDRLATRGFIPTSTELFAICMWKPKKLHILWGHIYPMLKALEMKLRTSTELDGSNMRKVAYMVCSPALLTMGMDQIKTMLESMSESECKKTFFDAAV